MVRVVKKCHFNWGDDGMKILVNEMFCLDIYDGEVKTINVLV